MKLDQHRKKKMTASKHTAHKHNAEDKHSKAPQKHDDKPDEKRPPATPEPPTQVEEEQFHAILLKSSNAINNCALARTLDDVTNTVKAEGLPSDMQDALVNFVTVVYNGTIG
jgi:hypothetical protein